MNCKIDGLPALGLMGVVTHRVMNRAKAMYQEFDMNGIQASILFSLNREDALSQKELAAYLHVTPPSITSAIQKMEREGYLTRHTDTADLRVMRLSLTAKGKECIRSVKKVAEDMEELMFSDIDDKEKQTFKNVLLKINDNLEKDAKERKDRL